MWARLGFIVLVFVSFCAFGCDGPQAPYPTYKEVHEAFMERDQAILGLAKKLEALEEKSKTKEKKK